MDHQKYHEEKRKHPRINERIPFQFKAEDYDIIAETINLSCSGVYCQVSEPIPFMTSLKVAFALPDYDNEEEPECVTCKGVVVRTEKGVSNTATGSTYNIAIFFNEIEDTDRKKIANFIERHRIIP